MRSIKIGSAVGSDELDTVRKRAETILVTRNRSTESRGPLLPLINVTDKKVILPDTYISNESNYVGIATIRLAEQLGYEISIIPYGERKLRDVPLVYSKWGIGFICATYDHERDLTIKERKDDVETGRIIFRSQQVLRAFTTNDKLGIDALKKNQRFFGNQPEKTEKLNNRDIPVPYIVRELHNCVEEQEWDERLVSILVTLIRHSCTLLDGEVLERAKRSNLLSYSEVVSLYTTRRVLVQPAQGRRPAVYRTTVPSKPKPSNLLLQQEQSLINEIITPVFQAPPFASSVEAWETAVFEKGFPLLKKELISSAGHKADLLVKFASMTTKRLNDVRRTSDTNKSKRKRDVQTTDLEAVVLRRSHPVSAFTDEVVLLDPHGDGCLARFVTGGSDSEKANSLAFRKAIKDWLDEKHMLPYQDGPEKTSRRDRGPGPERLQEIPLQGPTWFTGEEESFNVEDPYDEELPADFNRPSPRSMRTMDQLGEAAQAHRRGGGRGRG
jgi:hypothetical protein